MAITNFAVLGPVMTPNLSCAGDQTNTYYAIVSIYTERAKIRQLRNMYIK